jgi:hypothetical protein
VVGSGEEDFKKFLNIFFTFFLLLSPLVKENSLHLNLDRIPIKIDFCQVWLKLAQWFWRS